MKSMTGFGKAQKETSDYQIEVEIKSVNHRFLDIQLRIPRQLSQTEQEIRQLLKKSLQRGRVELTLTVVEKKEANKQAVIHWSSLQQVVSEIQQETKARFDGAEISSVELLQNLLTKEEFIEFRAVKQTDDSLTGAVLEAVWQAVLALNQSRLQEGKAIQAVLLQNQEHLKATIRELRTFVATFEEEYRQKFETKLMDYLGEQVDQSRLLTEMAILLERGDVHEEMDRMMIHLVAMDNLLTANRPIGRELDFLIQEMNREINTIGSKSSAIEIKNAVVQMKTIIEKIREQIQNIE